MRFPKYANAKVQTKNTAANTEVLRDKKLALPDAPEGAEIAKVDVVIRLRRKS